MSKKIFIPAMLAALLITPLFTYAQSLVTVAQIAKLASKGSGRVFFMGASEGTAKFMVEGAKLIGEGETVEISIKSLTGADGVRMLNMIDNPKLLQTLIAKETKALRSDKGSALGNLYKRNPSAATQAAKINLSKIDAKAAEGEYDMYVPGDRLEQFTEIIVKFKDYSPKEMMDIMTGSNYYKAIMLERNLSVITVSLENQNLAAEDLSARFFAKNTEKYLWNPVVRINQFDIRSNTVDIANFKVITKDIKTFVKINDIFKMTNGEWRHLNMMTVEMARPNTAFSFESEGLSFVAREGELAARVPDRIKQALGADGGYSYFITSEVALVTDFKEILNVNDAANYINLKNISLSSDPFAGYTVKRGATDVRADIYYRQLSKQCKVAMPDGSIRTLKDTDIIYENSDKVIGVMSVQEFADTYGYIDGIVYN
ncbi:hypothetical protein Dip518_001461 [Parelusimicrobium proximum]|uniref:hypothetical protein n=1 Tax=Parelusimicrobium proximum TaxID=3228953 RepID=UPI003D17EFF1